MEHDDIDWEVAPEGAVAHTVDRTGVGRWWSRIPWYHAANGSWDCWEGASLGPSLPYPDVSSEHSLRIRGYPFVKKGRTVFYKGRYPCSVIFVREDSVYVQFIGPDFPDYLELGLAMDSRYGCYVHYQNLLRVRDELDDLEELDEPKVESIDRAIADAKVKYSRWWKSFYRATGEQHESARSVYLDLSEGNEVLTKPPVTRSVRTHEGKEFSWPEPLSNLTGLDVVYSANLSLGRVDTLTYFEGSYITHMMRQGLLFSSKEKALKLLDALRAVTQPPKQ